MKEITTPFEFSKLHILEHLEELRSRLIKCAVVIVVSACAAYHYSGQILAYLAKPAGQLVFTSPTEGFLAYFKVAIWGGLFIASPFIIFQLWRFISAGLKPSEKRKVYLYMPFSMLLFLIGASFGFVIIVRFGIKFLLSFGTDFMVPMITISKYFSFVSSMCIAFGVVFQLPIVMLFLTKIGLARPSFLSGKRRHAIVFILIAAGILTPTPDPFNQLCMALPLYMLYEVGIILSKVAYRQRERARLAAESVIEVKVEAENVLSGSRVS